MGEMHTIFFVTKPVVHIQLDRYKWKHNIEKCV